MLPTIPIIVSITLSVYCEFYNYERCALISIDTNEPRNQKPEQSD